MLDLQYTSSKTPNTSRGGNATRRHAQYISSPAHNTESSAGLRAVLDISDELMAETSIDAIFRKAVELGRDKLNIERCSIWRLDRSEQRYHGTYGTNMARQTIDEHGDSFAVTNDAWTVLHRDRPSGERSWSVQVAGNHRDTGGALNRIWVAETPIVSRNGVAIAIMFNDCAITGSPMNEQQQDLIALYCSMLGNVLSQKELERELHGHTRELRAIVEIADELMNETALDAIWRKAVEAARSRLGIERCAIYRFEPGENRYVGTYGTDDAGNTTDERESSFLLSESEWQIKGYRSRAPGERIWTAKHGAVHAHYNNGYKYHGHGWMVCTPIVTRDGTERAIMFNDCAISGAPMDEKRQDLIAVYCSVLGGIANQKLLEQDLQCANAELERRVARRTEQLALHGAVERLVLDITSHLMQLEPADMDSGIAYALERVARHLDVHACRIFLLAEDGISLFHSYGWTVNGSTKNQLAHELRGFYRTFPWREQMLADQVIVLNNLGDMRPEMASFAQYLASIDIQATLTAPLITSGALIGQLSVDVESHPRAWKAPEITLLRMVGKAIAGALERARIARELRTERDSLEARVNERTQQLEAVLDLSQKISATLDLGLLLDQALGSLAQVMPYQRAVIWERESEDIYVPIRVRGEAGFQFQTGNWHDDHNPNSSMTRVIGSLQAVVLTDVWADTPAAQSYRHTHERVNGRLPTGVGSAMLIPMAAFGRVIGFISLSSAGRNDYDDHDAALAQALANQLAISVENARLHHKSVQAAALTERNRLARELHDSVSQALFGIVLAARTLMQSLPANDQTLPKIGDYMLRLSEAALSEMRALIFELRPESIEKLGLIEAIQKQAAELCEHNGLKFICASNSTEPALPVAAKESIYRIGMEAIQNVVKHAGATVVQLFANIDNGTLTLEIRDDGTGFDTTAEHPGHFGLRTMRERAGQLGGALRVSSTPGAGTTLTVQIPLNIIKSVNAGHW
jgi:signal transduction histidine kinase